MVVKIPIEDFTNVTLAKLLLELVIGVADMEVDKMFIDAFPFLFKIWGT